MRNWISLSFLLLSLTLSSRSADLLFAFAEGDAAARVYDASSLTLAASPEVVAGARVVFGEPGAEGYRRYFVVGRGGVSILDAGFQESARIALPDEELAPLQPAAFAPGRGSLLVTAGTKAYRIDTRQTRIATVVDVGATLAGIVLPAGSEHAYLIGADGRTVWRIGVSSGALDGPTASLPSVISALNGSTAMGESGLSLLDISRLPGGFFAPGERPSAQIATAGPLAASSRSAASPDGRFRWELDSAGRLRKTDLTSQSAPLMASDATFAAISLLPEPVEGNQGPQLMKVSGDGQLVPAGGDFTLQVNAVVTGGSPITTLIAPSLATCQPASLNRLTDINCTASASVTSSTQLQITVSAVGISNSVVFSVVIVPPGLQDGLTVVSGNNQSVNADAVFSFSVRSIQGGLPAAGQNATVTSISPAVVSCPSPRTLSSLGEATFSCTAQFVGAVTPVMITISDGVNSANVSVNVLPSSGGGTGGLVKISGDPVSVLEGASVGLTVETRVGGAPEPNVALNVATTGTALSCPAGVTTGSAGRALITCQGGQVDQNATVTVTISEGMRSATFTVTVVNQDLADGLQIVSGNQQIVSQNAPFPEPLVVSARLNGLPQNGLQLDIQTTNQNAVFCDTTVFTDNAGVGTINCNAGAVTGITSVQILVTDTLGRSLPTPFDVTVSPTTVGLATDIEVLTVGPIRGPVGSTVQAGLRIRAVNDALEPTPGQTIFFRSTQDISFNPAVVSTNLSGEATTDVVFGCPAASGTIQIGLSSTSTQATIGYQASNGPLSQLQIVQGNMQSGSPGVRLPQALVVRTADVCGNPVPNTQVAWGVNPPEAAALEVVGQVSNGQGLVSALARPTARGGGYNVIVAAEADSSIQASFSLTTANVPTFFQAVSGDGQQLPANSLSPEPLVVQVLSEQDQPVAGVAVAFTILSGEGSIESQSMTTDASGRAIAVIQAGDTLGELAVEATALGQTLTFTLEVIGATPILTADGFTNAASFRSGLSAGSAASIFAQNITGDVEGVLAAPYDPATGFPVALAGVRVLVNGVPAPILALVNLNGQEQINFQVPFETTGNFATVVVDNNGSQATITGVPVFTPQPGVFEVAVEGGTFAAALHTDFSLVTPSNPARPGQTIQLFLTGLGRLTPAVATNVEGPVPPAMTAATPQVTIDETVQTVVGSFYAPQLISVYPINLTLGQNVVIGNRSLQVTINGVSSKIVLLPVGSIL